MSKFLMPTFLLLQKIIIQFTQQKHFWRDTQYKYLAIPRPLFHFYFRPFSNKHHNFYNKYMWKYVHPVYGAGIWTHDLQNMSLIQ